MPVTTAIADDDDNEKRLDRISERFGKFRRHAKTDGSPEAAEMRRNRAVVRKTGSSTGQSGASNLSFATGRPRDPLFYWRENNLPYDFYKEGELKKVRELCRLLYVTHPIIASCIDIFSKLPLVGMELVHEDPQLVTFYEDLFFEQLNYREFLVDVGREFWLSGEAWPFGSFNEILGIWEDDELLNPDDVEVVKSPFLKDPRYLIRLPESIRRIIQDQSPRWEYEKLMASYPELKEYAGPDALMPVSNILLQQLRFTADTFHPRGIPILMRAFRAIMQEEMFMAAMDSIADRLYTPLILARLGAKASDLGTEVPWIPTEDDLADFEESLDAALAADFRVIVHHFGIEMEPVFGREAMPNMTEDFDRIEDRILQTFGLSKTMIAGADSGETYAADALNRDLIAELLTGYQLKIQRFWDARCKVVAEAQGHVEAETRNGKRYPVMQEVLEVNEETGQYQIVEQPKLTWPKLQFKAFSLTNRESEQEFIEMLVDKGVPISMRTRMRHTGLDLEEEIQTTKDEQIMLAVGEQETRKETFKALRADGLPLPDDLADDFQPRANNMPTAEEEAEEEGGEPGGGGPMTLPTLGADPVDTPALAPTEEDREEDPEDDEMEDTLPPEEPTVIPLPRNMMSNRVPESDEQRGGMPKPASKFETPKHIGKIGRVGFDKNKPLD